MPLISTVPRSHLEKTDRLDAEYYQPHYLVTGEWLDRSRTEPLNSLAFVSDGNHYKIADSFLDKPGVRYLRGQDVSGEMLVDDRNEVYIPESVFERIRRAQIHLDDVLVTIVGANTGLVGLVYDPPDKLAASCKLGIARAERIRPGYLFAFLISDFGQHQIRRAKRGGGQTGLILPDFRQLSIVRLSDNLESRIHEVVTRRHEAIKRSKRRYADSEERLLLELGLRGWQPPMALTFVRHSSDVLRTQRMDAEHFQPKYDALFATLKNDVNLDMLGNLVIPTKGVEVGSDAYAESGVPFWRVSNLTKHGLDATSVNFITDELYQSLCSNFEPRQGEFLISKDATPGVAYYLEAPAKGIVSSGILRLSPRKTFPPHYLELVLNSLFVRLQIEQDSGGSVIKHWKPAQVKTTLIPRLSRASEDAIDALVKESHSARREASLLLARARRAVELAITEGESHAFDSLA